MKFSIIIPIYKVEKYLHECVDSVLSQTFTDYEIILVDDGSPDDCPRICDEYAQKDKRIKVVHQANAGLACARNAGIEVASGEWLICIDSDDYFANNDVFQHVADKAEEGVDVVLYGFRKLYESNGRFVEFIFLYAIKLLIDKYSMDKILSLLVFATMGLFGFSLAGLKQVMAMALMLYAFYFLTNKKDIFVALSVFGAYMSHATSLIF